VVVGVVVGVMVDLPSVVVLVVVGVVRRTVDAAKTAVAVARPSLGTDPFCTQQFIGLHNLQSMKIKLL